MKCLPLFAWLLSIGATSGGELLPGGFIAPDERPPSSQIARPTQLRGYCTYKLLARPGDRIRLEVHAVRVGRYEGQVEVVVKDPSGCELAKASVPPAQSRQIEFINSKAEGLVTIECQAGRNAVGVTATGGRLLIPGGDATVKIVAYANPLYFFVEKGAREFPVHLAGQGKLETARAVVRDPSGKQAAAVSTIERSTQRIDVRVPPGMDGKLWSVHVTKASRGTFEDASLKLPHGVGPFLAEKASDVVIPALRLSAPLLVRPEDRQSTEAYAYVAQSLVNECNGLQLSVHDSAGRTVSSKTLTPQGGGPWNPTTALGPGEYRLRLKARIREREIMTEQGLYLVSRPKNLTANKTAVVNGKPFFARGLYHVQTQDYELAKAQGFNIVQAAPGQVPACERVGLKAAVVLYGGMRVQLDHYREMLLKHRNSSAVACWMTMDEPAAHGVPLDLMARGYATIRRLADHPAYTCICRPDAYADYGRCTDIIAVDVYPVGRAPLTNISDTLEIAKANVSGHTVWFIGQVWSWPNTRLVTPREHRCMSYLALTHADVRGLFWYSFRDPGWYLPESNKPVWEMCRRVNHELAQLEPVLLTNNIWERVQKTGGGEVHFAAKRHKDELYLIATNPTEHDADLDVDLRSEGAGGPATEVFEKRQIRLVDGHLKEHFKPLDTHVYAFALRR